MFEEEAEDNKPPYACCSFNTNCELWKDGFQKGAEVGYNKAKEDADKMKSKFLELCSLKDMRIAELEKANEWYYVKNGDLPNVETENYTYIRRRKRYERQFTDYRVIKCFVLCLSEKGKTTSKTGYFDCNKKCFLDEAEGTVIAWKEIVLPELKESE